LSASVRSVFPGTQTASSYPLDGGI
jgi:hypothetical protein